MNTKVLFKNTKAFRRLAKVYKDNKFIQNALYNWHKTDLSEKDSADFIYGYTFGERVALTEEVIEFGGLYDDMSKEDRDWRLYVKFNSPDDFYIEGETL